MLASIVSSSKSIDVEHTVSLESTNDIVAVMHTAVLADHLEIMLRTEKKVENQDHLISALNLVQTLLPRNESAIEMFRDICEILANEIALNSDSFSDLTYLIGRVTACIDFLLSCVINNPQKIEQVSCAIQRAFGVIGNGAFSFQDPSAIRGVFDWMLSSLETSISALHNIEVLRSYSEALRNINTAAISLDIFPKLQICELHANLLMEISNRLTDDETTASILPLVAMTCPTLLMSHTVIDAIRSNFCPGKSLFVLVSVAECIEEVNNANINLPPVLFDWIKNCRREVIGQFTRKDGTSRGLIENEVSQEQLKYVIEVLDSIKETPKCSEDTSSSFNSVTDR